MKKAIVECTYEVAVMLNAGRIRLPPDVVFDGMYEQFDRSSYLVRLAGNGLPDSCHMPMDGGVLTRATIEVDSTGTVKKINV